ncbi:xylogalacturonan beta-1,3-xylosyltransferase-like protein [Corchorus olitorius]|uniref:Xylogalacturonan beta-1,3-xylosyltransferase-like protein n=1 Tax=Corchorus olitorius TaxID=93759 RepID=A0A1R3HBK0_9ROSI|nr:xylogalacturonan beta-1,3-xylosyltransferase-like protein [Corchorus olitorius]
MLNGIQMRHSNTLHVQSCQPKWVNVPGGGTLFTTAKLVSEEKQHAESSSMAERRSRESAEFQMNIMLNGENSENLRLVGNGLYNFQIQDASISLFPIQEGVEETEQQTSAIRESTPNPGYKCSVNEENLVSVFLRDSPTDEEPKPVDQKQEEEDRNGKRVRMDDD